MFRILHVINWLRRGGVETQLLQILGNYDRSQFHMDVLCFGDEIGYLASEAEALGAEIFHCPKSVNLYSFSRRFKKLIVSRGYNILHCHSEAWSGPVLRGGEYAGIPVRIAHIRINMAQGFSIRNPLLKLGRTFTMIWGRYWLRKYATHVLGVSAATLDARFPKWRKKNNFGLWTLGVDIDRFTFFSGYAEVDTNAPVIINVASFSPQKRQDLIIRIFGLICRKMPDARLVLVGEGKKFQFCVGLAKDLGLSSRVEFLGLRDDIPELLNKASIFLSCSEGEGLPNVLLEAQASGLPVVASDIPPHREALHDTAHQFLFLRNGIQGAADNVVKLLNDRRLYDGLSKAARKFVVERYDAKRNLKKLEEMYLRWVSE